MQSLKEFAAYTKKTFSVKDTYAFRANAHALGITNAVFVTGAAYAICEELKHSHKDKKLAVVCGSGDKGATGLAIARRLLPYLDITTYFVGDPLRIKNQMTGLTYRLLNDIAEVKNISEENIDETEKELKKEDLILDAIIGCGLKGHMSTLMFKAITAINKTGKHVISIDIPSGIDGDTGLPNRAYIKAGHTFTVHKMKQGMDKSKFVGDVTIVDIGIPVTAELFAGPGDIMIATEERSLLSNKYTHGRVLVVGGSKVYHGAPLIASFAAENTMSALLTGSGYVTVAVPREVAEPVRKLGTDLIVKPLDWDDVEGTVASMLAVKHDALVIGPGLQNSETTEKIVEDILKAEKARGNVVVVDSTAMLAMSGHKNLIGKNCILTPHDGEFKSFSGINVKESDPHIRIRKAISAAKSQGFTLVLKGHETVITNGDLLKINRTNTPVLATMGTGDALAGMIAAYAAIHKSPFESAAAAVYAHSKAGDLLYERKGLHIASQDVVAAIPEVLKQFDTIRA